MQLSNDLFSATLMQIINESARKRFTSLKIHGDWSNYNDVYLHGNLIKDRAF